MKHPGITVLPVNGGFHYGWDHCYLQQLNAHYGDIPWLTQNLLHDTLIRED